MDASQQHLQPAQDCQRFSLALVTRLDEDKVLQILGNGYPASLDNEDSPGIFRTGYAAGAHDAYHEITPKLEQIGSVLHHVYRTLNELTTKHDNVEYLQDLATVRAHIVGYLVEESQDIRESTLRRLSETYGVPETMLDLRKHISDMPYDLFTHIGKTEGKKNPRRFAVFYILKGKMEVPESPTFDELAGRTDFQAVENVTLSDDEFGACTHRYGVFLTQHARKLYKELDTVLNGYRAAHEQDSASAAQAVIDSLRAHPRGA